MTRRGTTAYEKLQATKRTARNPRLELVLTNTRSKRDRRRRCARFIYSYWDGVIEVRRSIECPVGQEPGHVPDTTEYTD